MLLEMEKWSVAVWPHSIFGILRVYNVTEDVNLEGTVVTKCRNNKNNISYLISIFFI